MATISGEAPTHHTGREMRIQMRRTQGISPHWGMLLPFVSRRTPFSSFSDTSFSPQVVSSLSSFIPVVIFMFSFFRAHLHSESTVATEKLISEEGLPQDGAFIVMSLGFVRLVAFGALAPSSVAPATPAASSSTRPGGVFPVKRVRSPGNSLLRVASSPLVLLPSLRAPNINVRHH